MPWYRSGNVSITNGQTTVTGTSTDFALNARVGDAFQGPDGRWYEVANIASSTVLSILPAYQGPTVTAGTYGLAPMQGYVKESADRLRQLLDQFGSTLALLGTPADAAGLRANIGAAARGPNNDITSLDGLTTALSIDQGGTGSNTAAGAVAALGAKGSHNLFINPRFRVNQRGYVSGTAVAAGQYTLDRLKMSVAGQALSFAASGAGVRATFPAGGCDQVVLGENVRGGVYTLSWVGTAVAKVNGVVIANGGQTPSMPAGANITINLSGGWAEDVMFQHGSVATPPDDRGYASELFDCMYYGWALRPAVSGQPICSVTFTYSAYTAIGVLRFPRAMRSNPTASFLAGAPASLTITGGGGGGIACDNLLFSNIGSDSCMLTASISTAFAMGYGSILAFGAFPNLFFSAEV